MNYYNNLFKIYTATMSDFLCAVLVVAALIILFSHFRKPSNNTQNCTEEFTPYINGYRTNKCLINIFGQKMCYPNWFGPRNYFPNYSAGYYSSYYNPHLDNKPLYWNGTYETRYVL
jgi:hypothetical protein